MGPLLSYSTTYRPWGVAVEVVARAEVAALKFSVINTLHLIGVARIHLGSRYDPDLPFRGGYLVDI